MSMTKSQLKNFLTQNLPSDNEIRINVLRAVLRKMVDENILKNDIDTIQKLNNIITDANLVTQQDLEDFNPGNIDIDSGFDQTSDKPLKNSVISEFRRLVLDTIAEAPNYVSPTASISVSNQTIEKGDNFSETIDISFNQNDAGIANAFSLKENNTSVSTTQSTEYSKNNITSEITLQGTVSYNAGPVKDNNLGEQDDTGRITAGNINTASRNIVPRLKIFFGPVVSLPTTSANIRSLPNSVWDNQNQINLQTGTVNNKFVVLIPRSITTANSISAQDTTNNVGYDYTYQSTLVLDLVNGTEEYGLYVLSLDNSYPNNANHTINI